MHHEPSCCTPAHSLFGVLCGMSRGCLEALSRRAPSVQCTHSATVGPAGAPPADPDRLLGTKMPPNAACSAHAVQGCPYGPAYLTTLLIILRCYSTVFLPISNRQRSGWARLQMPRIAMQSTETPRVPGRQCAVLSQRASSTRSPSESLPCQWGGCAGITQMGGGGGGSTQCSGSHMQTDLSLCPRLSPKMNLIHTFKVLPLGGGGDPATEATDCSPYRRRFGICWCNFAGELENGECCHPPLWYVKRKGAAREPPTPPTLLLAEAVRASEAVQLEAVDKESFKGSHSGLWVGILGIVRKQDCGVALNGAPWGLFCDGRSGTAAGG